MRVEGGAWPSPADSVPISVNFTRCTLGGSSERRLNAPWPSSPSTAPLLGVDTSGALHSHLLCTRHHWLPRRSLPQCDDVARLLPFYIADAQLPTAAVFKRCFYGNVQLCPSHRLGLTALLSEFDGWGWLQEVLLGGRHDDMKRYEEKAPHGRMAHPSPDHLYPLYVALSATREGAKAELIHQSWYNAMLSHASYRFTVTTTKNN
ncbi:hypothetical protein E2562_027348 [Oryza meyeriana var. granulata]|uniref:Extradiol ring-cleavage dioxygenase class III enzyme subunit B domain-containing protein n=1 Tax=Oryza meyeriana var. granulata TaxID=110450 RepID=A0A6G1E2A9_9ORYZ|nr:hypothetical protein E2562_027348 [Oryza meyeriana var. granulata]